MCLLEINASTIRLKCRPLSRLWAIFLEGSGFPIGHFARSVSRIWESYTAPVSDPKIICHRRRRCSTNSSHKT